MLRVVPGWRQSEGDQGLAQIAVKSVEFSERVRDRSLFCFGPRGFSRQRRQERVLLQQRFFLLKHFAPFGRPSQPDLFRKHLDPSTLLGQQSRCGDKTTRFLSSSSPKRDCCPKRVNVLRY